MAIRCTQAATAKDWRFGRVLPAMMAIEVTRDGPSLANRRASGRVLSSAKSCLAKESRETCSVDDSEQMHTRVRDPQQCGVELIEIGARLQLTAIHCPVERGGDVVASHGDGGGPMVVGSE